jgi:hypothetical protein
MYSFSDRRNDTRNKQKRIFSLSPSGLAGNDPIDGSEYTPQLYFKIANEYQKMNENKIKN